MVNFRSLKLNILLLAILLAGCDLRLNPKSLETRAVRLPVEYANISFGDLTYDEHLKLLIAPAAETGTLALVNPQTLTARLIEGFSTTKAGAAPASGAVSAVVVRDLIYALDRTARTINIIDPETGKIIGSTPVQAEPGYIRYVSSTNELWVTEPSAEKIEVFQLEQGQPPRLTPSTNISVPNGPEYLLIDRTRGLAFTNQPEIGMTVVMQVQTHNIIYHWGNGCSQARGMAVDEERGYLFIACQEGKVVVMDIVNNGIQLTSQNYGGDLSTVAYNPGLGHLYVPSAKSGIVAIFDVAKTSSSNAGSQVSLKRLGTADTALKAGCVAPDGHNHIWVCDPLHGQLLLIEDTFQAGGP